MITKDTKKINLINPNGTLVSISQRSYDLLTAKGKARFQILEDPVKVRIPNDVIDYMDEPPLRDTPVRRGRPRLIPLQENPEPDPEPIEELMPKIEPEPEPIPEVPEPEPELPTEITQIPELKDKMTSEEYNKVPIKLSNVPTRMTQMNKWKTTLRNKGVKFPITIKFDDLKKLYDANIGKTPEPDKKTKPVKITKPLKTKTHDTKKQKNR